MCGNFDGNNKNEFEEINKKDISDFETYGNQFLIGKCPDNLLTMNDVECKPIASHIS